MRVRPRHYWRRYLRRAQPELFAAVPCHAESTTAMLSHQPQAALSCFDRFIAFLTTPFKRFGISGWKETGCDGQARGLPVRDAQHSTDGFWTIDVRLEAFAIGQTLADLTSPRYLRLEVEPGTPAHVVCAENRIGPQTDLALGGAIVIDTDGPFLEIHPEENFRIVAVSPSLPGRGSG